MFHCCTTKSSASVNWERKPGYANVKSLQSTEGVTLCCVVRIRPITSSLIITKSMQCFPSPYEVAYRIIQIIEQLKKTSLVVQTQTKGQ